MADQQLTNKPEGYSPAVGVVGRHGKVVAALLGAVVFQLALMSSFTGAEARPALYHVTIGLVGAAPVVPGSVGHLPGAAVSYQRFSDPASARQAVRDGELPAALLVTSDHETIVVAEAAGLTLLLPSSK
jgi:hypothetical protein